MLCPQLAHLFMVVSLSMLNKELYTLPLLKKPNLGRTDFRKLREPQPCGSQWTQKRRDSPQLLLLS